MSLSFSRPRIRLVLPEAGLLEEDCRIIRHAPRPLKTNECGWNIVVNPPKLFGNHEGKYGKRALEVLGGEFVRTEVLAAKMSQFVTRSSRRKKRCPVLGRRGCNDNQPADGPEVEAGPAPTF